LILQIGAFFGSLVGGIGTGLGQILKAAIPTGVGIGQQFLQRELNRKLGNRQKIQLGATAVNALNSPGIAVARVGGTIQPVGGRVQRSTFTPAALAPAQNPFGNIPLLPVGIRSPMVPLPGPFAGFGQLALPLPSPPSLPGRIPMPNGALARIGAAGEPRFTRDQFGKTVMFVPSPRPGEGFIAVATARQLGLAPTKPFWRFNRGAGED